MLAYRRMIFRIIFSVLLAVDAIIANWLILGESSPFHEHFLWHGDLPNLWATMHIVPVICSAIVAGDPHSAAKSSMHSCFVIQWFIIGFLLSGLLVSLRFWKT